MYINNNFFLKQHRNEKKPDAHVLSIQTLLIVTVFVFVIESNIYIVIAIKGPRQILQRNCLQVHSTLGDNRVPLHERPHPTQCKQFW